MKNSFFYSLIFIAFLNSCKKESTVSNSNIDGCLLKKSFRNSVLTDEYIYDELNNLTDIKRYQGGNYIFETYSFFYNNSKISRIELHTELNDQIICANTVYEYDIQERISEVLRYSEYEPQCNESNLTSTTKYFYSSNNILDSTILLRTNQLDAFGYNKLTSTYDLNSNYLIQNCYIDSLHVSTANFEFDNKFNPLFGYFNNGMNNLVKRTSQRLDIPVQSTESIYNFEYNDFGYPKSRTFNYSNGIIELIEYEYICDQ